MGDRRCVEAAFLRHCCSAGGVVGQGELKPDEIVILATPSHTSREVAQYYAEHRGVPANHIVVVDMKPDADVDRAAWDKVLRPKIRATLGGAQAGFAGAVFRNVVGRAASDRAASAGTRRRCGARRCSIGANGAAGPLAESLRAWMPWGPSGSRAASRSGSEGAEPAARQGDRRGDTCRAVNVLRNSTSTRRSTRRGAGESFLEQMIGVAGKGDVGRGRRGGQLSARANARSRPLERGGAARQRSLA